MSKRKEDISIRSSAGEYLSYVASTGNGDVNMEFPNSSRRGE